MSDKQTKTPKQAWLDHAYTCPVCKYCLQDDSNPFCGPEASKLFMATLF